MRKKTIILPGSWFIFLTILLFFHSGCVRIPQAELENAELIQIDNEIVKSQLRYTVDELCRGEPRNFRNIKRLNEAGSFIESEFIKLGYSVERQEYEVDQQTYFNICATTPKSQEDKRPLVIIGAHYDVCGNTPGADDNASGVAVLLELARLWKEHASQAPIRVEFVAYTLEEPPFFNTDDMGSRVHAMALKSSDTKLAYMISLEMLGYYNDGKKSQRYPSDIAKVKFPSVGNFLSVIANTESFPIAKKFVLTARHCGNLPVEYITLPEASTNFSDHYIYYLEGYKAFIITDTAWYRNQHYHQQSDTPETLDYARMAETVKVLMAFLTNITP